MKKENLVAVLFIAILVAVVFLPIYGALVYRFTAYDTYYSHGFLVPLVSLYLVFRKRKTLKAIEPKPYLAGLFIFTSGLVLHVISLALKVRVTSYLSIPVVMLGIVLFLGGKKFARELLFPIGFLIFGLPLPKVLIIGIAFKLKIMATQAAVFLVNLIGIEAVRAGSAINYPGGQLMVGDPCSGLRSLITFLALGALFTQFTNASALRRGTLFISTIPIALFSNFIRLAFLVLVGFIYGEKAATGFLHDSSGLLVFVLGFFGLVMVSKVLRCRLCAETI